MSPRLRSTHRGTAAHTEITRLLAEHGLFGLIAVLLLMGLAVRAWIKAPDAVARGFVAACVVWSLTEMGHSAMRIAVTAFVFGLGMLGVDFVGRVRTTASTPTPHRASRQERSAA